MYRRPTDNDSEHVGRDNMCGGVGYVLQHTLTHIPFVANAVRYDTTAYISMQTSRLGQPLCVETCVQITVYTARVNTHHTRRTHTRRSCENGAFCECDCAFCTCR